MDLYTKLAQTAAVTLKKNGKPIVTRRVATSSFDPVESKVVATYTEVTRNGLISKVTEQLISEVRKIGNSNILITDALVIFGPDGDTSETDLIVLDSIPCQVVKVMPIKPTDTAILFKVVVRR